MAGDDDQSICGWRGGDVRKILGFPRDFKGAKVVRLQTNYRSTRPILAAANGVIRHNSARHDKSLESARGAGAPVRSVRLKDETAEAQFVVTEMRTLLREDGVRPRDLAVLCRTQVQFRPFEAELRAHGLPYVVVGGMSFFDRNEVRDVVAFLRLATNPRDETALLRVVNTPPRGVGKASLDKLLDFATSHGIAASEAFERASEIEGLAPQAVEGYRALRAAIDGCELADAGTDLVARLECFLETIAYRDEVRRLYPDPMTREARWAGVVEILNFADKIKYASQSAITITLGSLATSSTKVAGRESTVVDNTTNVYDDALVSGWVKLGTSPTDAKSVDVWVYAQHMDGSSYVDVFDGTDSDETINHVNIRNSGLRLAATAVTDNTTGRVVPFAPFCIAARYGGVMPLKWGLFVTHDTGVAFDSTNGNHCFNYVGITYQSV